MVTTNIRVPPEVLPRRSGTFTLIELLVVIAIIMILAAMLLPALSQAREMAKRVTCIGHQKQLLMAESFYADEYDGWFPGAAGSRLIGGYSRFMTWASWLNGTDESGNFKPGSPVYVVGKKLFLCPSARPDLARFSYYRTYGMLLGGKIDNVDSNRWIKNGYQCPAAVANPALAPLFADTATATTFPRSQWYYFYTTSTPEDSMIHLRHSYQATMGYYDGHVEAKGVLELRACGIITARE